MATIDINQYIEQSGMRKARFGGYEPDDVRQAMLDLCSDYEQRLNTAAQQVRGAQQEAEALRRRCQTLIGQNQNLATQNASLAGKADRIARMQSDMETRYSKVQERNHSLTDQVAMLRLKNTDLELKNKELTERAENADAALRIKGREHDQAKQQVLAERDSVVAGAQKEAARIRSQAREEADQLLKDTNLKAEAIDQLAREQAIGQARNRGDPRNSKRPPPAPARSAKPYRRHGAAARQTDGFPGKDDCRTAGDPGLRPAKHPAATGK